MTLKEAVNAVAETGYPLATFAKNIGRDPATIYKWLRRDKNISEEVQNEVRKELIRLKAEWSNIELE